MAVKRKKIRRTKMLYPGCYIGIFLVISALAGIALLLWPLEKENPNTSSVLVYPSQHSKQSPLPSSEARSERAISLGSDSSLYSQNNSNQHKSHPQNTMAAQEGSSSTASNLIPIRERNTSLVHTRSLLKQGKLAIVIDDAGYDLIRLKAFLDFPGKLTIAVLPQLRYSLEAAKLSRQAGKEVLLHQPLQPLGAEAAGPGSIEVTFDRKTIFETLTKNLKSVPYAVGVNNHMGSLATQDRMVMDALFEKLKEEGLFFLDSRTVATTVVRDAASKYGVPYLERNIFLDSGHDLVSMQKALADGVSLAQANGQAILIGHVQHQELAELLKKNYTEYLNSGIEFVFVSELLSMP